MSRKWPRCCGRDMYWSSAVGYRCWDCPKAIATSLPALTDEPADGPDGQLALL